jgi:hypothetical protein
MANYPPAIEMLRLQLQRVSVEVRVRSLVARDRLIAEVTKWMLRLGRVCRLNTTACANWSYKIVVRTSCRRYCRISGIGSVTARTFEATIDEPLRLIKVKDGRCRPRSHVPADAVFRDSS